MQQELSRTELAESAVAADPWQVASRPRVSVVIASKDRKDDLRRAIASCLRQSVAPEIIVLDDGSSDGTSEMVQREFPTVRLHRDEAPQSVVVQRNRGARMAAGEFIVSIDDDAEFPSPDTIAQTLAEFDHPKVGAVAIPFVNVTQSPEVLQQAPDRPGKFLIANFWGTAYAVRRRLFLELGGYRESLRQEMEEEDFCIRMLDAGYFICMGRAEPIHHYFSPSRDNRWRNVRGSRNRVLFCWLNVPMPDLLVHVPGICANRLKHGLRSGYLAATIEGLGLGFLDWLRDGGARRPVRQAACRLFRRLRRAPGLPLAAGLEMLEPRPLPGFSGLPWATRAGAFRAIVAAMIPILAVTVATLSTLLLVTR